ncbi:autotransporter domain-containing esterase [Brevundimonas sp. LM2]|uniref:autotransporter domain-containing protein n=1 Tax=Brevundimonas sp. LM2 TaxID=1938605 RepID=UPI000983CDA8|nr:autotransporter domain-containing protein [Brevundimonas sp. LM2]AQR62313.1 autotransporter domain-containing esterase [Brevundimonas sp. LM2]
MSRFHRGAALAALTLAASASLAGAASAQSYNRLVVFGDSLSDNGNLFAISGQPPAPYFQGRFSNGPVFTELLGFTAGRFTAGAPVTGSVNYAFGGARTDFAASPPGMRAQLAAYTAAGGRFGSGDLVSVLGGANNIFQAFPGAAASPATAQATMANVAVAAAGDINLIVNTVAQAGAGTVLVTNLPRLGITPQFAASNPLVGAQGSALADFAGSTFNSALSTGLMATAPNRPGTNIILFDIAKISDTLASDPGRFGLNNVTAPCFNGVTLCATPDTYLYFDGVHPTAAGHRLFAALANDYLYYGDLGSASTLQGETAFRHHEDTLSTATDSLSGRGPWEAGTQISVTGGYDRTKTDARTDVAEATADGAIVRAALESGTEALRFGLAGTFREGDVEAGPNRFALQSIGLDVYAGYRSGSAFVNAAVGFAGDDYNDIERVSTLSPVVMMATTRGQSTGARVQGGVWMELGGIAVSPRAAVSYVTANVDGYREQGVAAAYQYGNRTVKAVTAEASVRAEGEMGGFGVFVEGGYRDSLDDQSTDVRVGIANNPAQIVARGFDDPFGGQVLASAGVSGDLGPVKVELSYKGRFGDRANSNMGGFTFTLPL